MPTWDTGSNDIELCIEEFELPSGGARFFQELEHYLDPKIVCSVLLFGSIVSEEVSEMSDIDLIIILEDNASEDDAIELREKCDELAEAHLSSPTTEPNFMEHHIDQSTGMFRSGFVTFRTNVLAGDFDSIFNTSRAAYALAPWRTVLYGVFESVKPLYGELVKPELDPELNPFTNQVGELSRSFIMTAALSITQIVYQLFSPRAFQYSLEAFKWTAYTCAMHIKQGQISGIRESLYRIPLGRFWGSNFLRLRNGGDINRSAIFLIPIFVCIVHLRSLLRVCGVREYE